MTDAAGGSAEAMLEGPVERLHPRIRLVWVGWAVVAALVVALLGWFVEPFGRLLLSLPDWTGSAVLALAAVVAVLGVLHAVARYRVWRFQLQDDALSLERGVLTRVETAVPYVRVQHIDTRRGPIDRLVGLSSVVVYTAGSRGADVTVPGLAPERARRLRDRLRELAVEAEPGDAV
jgi:membrane protein YdbS with pleckstrin-like domain